MAKVYAIILAGGVGSRLKSKTPKQFLKVNGKTILEHTVEKFNRNRNIDHIVLVVNSQYCDMFREKGLLNKYEKLVNVIEGGKLGVRAHILV